MWWIWRGKCNIKLLIAEKWWVYDGKIDKKCKYFITMKCDAVSPLMENVRFLREGSFVPINIESTPKSKLACFLSYLTPKWGCSSCY